MTQRRAWADVVYEAVAPGVYRIPVEMPGDALEATNVYAVVGANEVGLVDAGWFAGGAMGDLERGLEAVGADIDAVTTVAVTHIHPDHYTLAVELMRSRGCAVYLGGAERTSLAAIHATDRGRADFVASLVRCGVSAEQVEAYWRSNAEADKYAPPTGWLSDGDEVRLGDLTVEAVETPGHTRGHICFAADEVDVLFTGDHILPGITPSVGFEPSDHQHRSLVDYLDSLARVRKRRDSVMLPAHGPVKTSVHERVDELLAHHEMRLGQCGDAVAAGARTAFEVAKSVPWTKKERSLDELGSMDQLMAVHETRAHLEVLDLQGRVRRASDGEVDEYVVA